MKQKFIKYQGFKVTRGCSFTGCTNLKRRKHYIGLFTSDYKEAI